MRNYFKYMSGIFLLGVIPIACAQDVAKQDGVSDVDAKSESTQLVQKNDAAISKAPPSKKMIQDATINLQTTITGNQEQPRVLYILPWQSPKAEEVDFEPLDNQQKSVFGHIEREELRRELESAGELQ